MIAIDFGVASTPCRAGLWKLPERSNHVRSSINPHIHDHGVSFHHPSRWCPSKWMIRKWVREMVADRHGPAALRDLIRIPHVGGTRHPQHLAAHYCQIVGRTILVVPISSVPAADVDTNRVGN